MRFREEGHFVQNLSGGELDLFSSLKERMWHNEIQEKSMNPFFIILFSFSFLLTSCGGVKVIHPKDQNKNAGTLALDKNGKLIGTFTCSVVASNGKRVSAIGTTIDEARENALSECRSKTLISVCLAKNTKMCE